MKKYLFFLLSIFFCIFLFGCGAAKVPFNLPTMTTFQVSENNYEILSDQEVSGTAGCGKFFYMIGGNAGYIKAYRNALAKYPGANILINAKVDVKYSCFLIWEHWTTEVSGFPAKMKTK
jgi:dolichol kinase